MARKPRLNKIIALLEEGKPAFGTIAYNGDLDGMTYVANAGYDFIFIENEHVGLDFTNLRISLQFLLNRKKLGRPGSLQAEPTPLVRVPTNAEEIASNQWVIKQTLDHGVYGIVLPKLETVEAARSAIAGCRYFKSAGVSDTEPVGERGWSPARAAQYWGLPVLEYFEAADLWPLDPDGELLLMAICESAEGVKNLPDILEQTRGIGMVLAGPGDLAVSMGKAGNIWDPDVQDALQKTLEACKRFDVACATVAATAEEVDQRLEQGFRAFITPYRRENPALDRGLYLRRSGG